MSVGRHLARWRQALLWLSLTLVVLVIVGAVVLWLHLRSGPVTTVAERPLAALARSAVQTVPAPAPMATSAESRVTRSPQPTAEASAHPSASAVWDLCGVGRVPVPAGERWGVDWPELPPALGEGPALEALEAAWLRLTDSHRATPREQAAAWRLMLAVAPDETSRAEAEAALQRLAQDSGDPVIFAWLLSNCGSPQRPCDPELLAAWRAAEPGNLTPWLIQWVQAPEDRAATWVGIEQVTHFHRYDGRWAGVVDTALPKGTPVYVRGMLATALVGIEAAVGVPYLGPDVGLCGVRGEPDPSERARCDKLARVAAKGSDDLLGLGVAVRYARRADWPLEVVQALQAESDRLQAQWPSVFTAQPLSCAVLEPALALTERRAAVGERRALHEWAETQGQASMPVLVLPAHPLR